MTDEKIFQWYCDNCKDRTIGIDVDRNKKVPYCIVSRTRPSIKICEVWDVSKTHIAIAYEKFLKDQK